MTIATFKKHPVGLSLIIASVLLASAGIVAGVLASSGGETSVSLPIVIPNEPAAPIPNASVTPTGDQVITLTAEELINQLLQNPDAYKPGYGIKGEGTVLQITGIVMPSKKVGTVAIPVYHFAGLSYIDLGPEVLGWRVEVWYGYYSEDFNSLKIGEKLTIQGEFGRMDEYAKYIELRNSIFVAKE